MHSCQHFAQAHFPPLIAVQQVQLMGGWAVQALQHVPLP